jgi:N-acetylglutamate synthase-like GNAT family acetyltransferase
MERTTMTDLRSDFTSHSGFKFHIRPARPEDEAALGEFFGHVTPEDLRFRFLSSVKEVGHDRLAAMTDVDHRQTESFMAFQRDGGPLIATAMLACDVNLDVGEVAIAVRADYKNLGIGWELLGHLTQYAELKGVKRLQSLESRANGAAIQLEKELGFTSETYQGDSTLVLLQKILVQ